MLAQTRNLKGVLQIDAVMVAKIDAFYRFISQAYFWYLGDLTFCVPEIFGNRELWEKFAEFEFGILLLRIWWCYLLMGCFDKYPKEQEG